MEVDFKLIGERMKKARNELGLTQEKLAEELDVTVPLISRVERGYVQVSLQRLGQIAEWLNMSLEELITGVSKTKQNYLGQELQTIIGRCTPDKQKLIYNIAKIIEKAKFVWKIYMYSLYKNSKIV